MDLVFDNRPQKSEHRDKCVHAGRVWAVPTRYTSSKSSLAQFLPRSSGSMGSPCPCGVDAISALRKEPFSVSATRVRPKPGDLWITNMEHDYCTFYFCFHNETYRQYWSVSFDEATFNLVLLCGVIHL